MISLWILVPLAALVALGVWALGTFVILKLTYSPQKVAASANRKQLAKSILSGGSLTLGEAAWLEDFDTGEDVGETVMIAALWPIWVPFYALPLSILILVALVIIQPIKLAAHLAGVRTAEWNDQL